MVLLGFGQIGRTLAALHRPGAPAGALAAGWPRSSTAPASSSIRRGSRPRRLAALAAGEAQGPAAWPTRPSGQRRHAREEAIAAHRELRADPPGAGRPHRRRHRARARARRSPTAWTWCWPTSGRSPAGAAVSEALWQTARARGRRILHEATVGAGLPIIDTYHKLIESRRPGGAHRGAALGHARVRAERGLRRGAVLPGGARGDGEGLHRARSARGPLGHGRRAQGAHPRAAARLPGRAAPQRGRVAGARVGARAPARRVPRAAGGARRRLAAAGRGGRRDGSGAPLRRDGHAAQDRGRAPRGAGGQPARRDQGLRQPARLHHRALQGEPAGHHRARRRRRGHGRRRAQRHPPRWRAREPPAAASPRSRPAASATSAPGSTSSGWRWPARATRCAPSGATTPGIPCSTRAIPSCPGTRRATPRPSPRAPCSSAAGDRLAARPGHRAHGDARGCRSPAARAAARPRRWRGRWP